MKPFRTVLLAGLGALALVMISGVEECQPEPECEAPSDCGAYETCVDGQCVYVCEAEGGEVSTGLCCESVGDFPNTCVVGACGCAPEYSHDVLVCQCPAGTCWDGQHCVEGFPY